MGRLTRAALAAASAERFRRALTQDFPATAVLAAATREEAIPLAAGATAIVALDSQFHALNMFMPPPSRAP